MPAKTSTLQQDQTKELLEKLETGMKDLFSGDKYKSYLHTMAQFHSYSARNVMLIEQQMPSATKIASYNTWKNKFGRQVNRNEKGLKIFAPMVTKPETLLVEKLDKETGAPLLDSQGKVIMEELTEVPSEMRFKLVSVFDISQTHGEPLPELIEDLTGNVEHYEAFLDTLKTISPLPIKFETMNPDQDGYCRYGEHIGIRENMSEVQTISAIVHEITHARLHSRESLMGNETSKSNEVKEIEAESVSYVVCQKYGIETGANSFGYLAEWGSHDMREIHSSLETIRKEASKLINAIDDRFAFICKEKGIDLTAPTPQIAEQQEQPKPPQPQEKPSVTEFTTKSTTENIAGVDFTFTEVNPITSATPEKENALQTLPEIMPDPTIGIAERDNYGYTQEEMLPLQQARAVELFDSDHTIYLLFNNNAESMAFDVDEINKHSGIFGIERKEWEESPMHKETSIQEDDSPSTVADPAAADVKPMEQTQTEELKPQEKQPIVASNDTQLIAETTPTINEIPPHEVPIYKQTAKEAAEYGQGTAYADSRYINISCAESIDKAIKENKTGTHNYDLKSAARSVTGTYGKERVSWVLSSIIQNDSSFSKPNKDWANKTQLPNEKPAFACMTHKAILEKFAVRFQEVAKEKPPMNERLVAAKMRSDLRRNNPPPSQGAIDK